MNITNPRSLRIRIVTGAVAATAAAFAGSHFGSIVRAETPTTRPNPPAAQDAGAIARIDDFASAMRSVGHAVEPSVVSIEVEKRAGADSGDDNSPDDQLKRFFPDQDGDGKPDVPPGLKFRFPKSGGGNSDKNNDNGDNGADQGPAVFGEGSGVILDVDGKTAYILTNNHVAGDAVKLRVVLADGRRIDKVDVIGTDPLTDLAVLKVEGADLHGAKWGDSGHLEQGDVVIAFGAPFGYVGSMTQGIVSALNRSNVGILGQNGYENFIQTDCAINPGNSGGPLVNIHGEVIGINTAIATRSGAFAGIGFAIPSQLAQHVYEQIKSEGHVTRGFLGVDIRDASALNTHQAQKLGLAENQQGVFVAGFRNDTPADGKLEPNDVITTIDGQPVHNAQELRFKIATTTPGTNVKLGILRGGEHQDVDITVGTLPDDGQQARRNSGKLGQDDAKHNDAGVDIGATLADATGARLRSAGLPTGTRGAIVTAIDPTSPAAEAGLQIGDLIKKVGDKTVTTAADAMSAIRGQNLKEGFDILVQNRTGTRSLFVQSDGADNNN